VVATRAEAEVKAIAVGNAVDMVDVVESETATNVSTLIAKLTAILQMHAKSPNALRREETTLSAFGSSTGFQATSMSIVSPTNVCRNGGE